MLVESMPTIRQLARREPAVQSFLEDVLHEGAERFVLSEREKRRSGTNGGPMSGLENVDVTVNNALEPYATRELPVVQLMRTIGETNAGTYRQGRHNWPSRIEWHEPLQHIAEQAIGDASGEPSRNGVLQPDDPSVITIPLPGDRTIKAVLPDDIADADADLVAAYLKAFIARR